MLNLKIASTTHELDKKFRSHPHKALRIHTNGVFEGVERHTRNRIALLAALWHDAGKLNPNFQPKLDGEKAEGYANHAYLSALIFLAYYCQHQKIREIGLNDDAEIVALLAIIAHHHGHLPHLRSIFSSDERDRLFTFIETNPELPADTFMAQYNFAAPFEVQNPAAREKWRKFGSQSEKYTEKINAKFDFWLETQFSFAALIESDKRDASDNKEFRRKKLLVWAQTSFAGSLQATFDELAAKPEAKSDLNQTRTQIRREALESLREKLAGGQRMFSLTAPTGAGKTFMLLELANEIRAHKGDYGVIYGLPFLSITEQVEAICREIWKANPEFVSRVDSRAHDTSLEELIEKAETDPEAAKELAREDFSLQTFDTAFTITTFVQIFETLLSNRNATLLKLPNFAKTIFLLDEIQALPPRLYLFLSAYLQRFCEKFDCYAILSTATMPHLELIEQKWVKPKLNPKTLFPNYQTPMELLNYKDVFALPVFARYRIEVKGEWNMEKLAEAVENEAASTLIILNTIADTRELYKKLEERPKLKGAKLILLNTHFVLDDRRAKIDECKRLLKLEQKAGQRVVLISTQLIEAGVDVDFAVVMRDLCPLPSLIQSAGRCNRNGEMGHEAGRVIFFTLTDDKGVPRANSIYRLDADQKLLRRTQNALAEKSDSVTELELLDVQQAFFRRMAEDLEVGRHPLWVQKGGDEKSVKDENANLIEYLRDFNFPVVGSFRLIDEAQFGEQFQIYVPSGANDENWSKLEECYANIIAGFIKRVPMPEKIRLDIVLNDQLKAMSGRILSVRCSPDKLPRLRPRKEEDALCGLRYLVNFDFDYNSDIGLQFDGQSSALI